MSGVIPYIPEGVDKELEDVLFECWQSTEMFCKVFMPRSFTKPFSAGHREVFALLDDDSKQKVAIAAHRGFGKTSIINNAFPAKRIVFRDNHYIIPISATGPAAKEYSENLKNELLTNEELTEVFGPIKSTDVGSYQKDSFSTLEWVTSTGIKVMPRGAGQQLRGRIFRNHRPDLYIVDDIEDDEAVQSEDQRRKLKIWFLSALRNSVEFSDPRWRIIVIGSILHEDSLLSNLMNKDLFPDWHTASIELCDDDCNSNWEAHMPTPAVKALRQEYVSSGMLDVFYREFRNLPIAIESRGFRPEYFHSYNEETESLNENLDIETVILSDPARTMGTHSCKTALSVISINTNDDSIYVRKIVEDVMNPDEQLKTMFDLAEEFNALVLAPEVTGLNEYIMYPIRNEMIKRKKHYIIIEVKPREGKTGPRRAGGLIPLYKSGLIKHNKATTAKLERLLLMYPRPESWDIIDSVSGILFVMEEGQRYFSPKNLGEQEDVEEEYKELQNDDALQYERVI